MLEKFFTNAAIKSGFIVFLLTVLICNAQPVESTVKPVVLVPEDVSLPSDNFVSKYSRIIRDIQLHFRDEMKRHGYGNKTFRLEMDSDNMPEITVVRGKHPKSIYRDKTVDNVVKEILDGKFAGLDNVYVVVVMGLELVDNIHGGLATFGNDSECGGCRGVAVLTESDRSFSFSIMAHELGHAFGLSHISHTKGEFLMGSRETKYPLADYEAHWLSVHPYFNNRVHQRQMPVVDKVHAIEALGDDWLMFSIELESSEDLHQAQLVKHNNVIVVSWDIT